jgi:hypothetical protein
VPTHLELEGRVLNAGEGAAGRAQRRIVGVPVSFFEHHGTIVVGVGRTEQTRDQRMREEGALQLIGFLRVFVRRARREEGHAFTAQAYAAREVEHGNGASAFHARERARAAGIHDQDAERRRRASHELGELPVLEARRAEPERLSVGVARVVDEQQGFAVRRRLRRTHPIIERD